MGSPCRSQMSAWLSSPVVQMWHALCGAHATALTLAVCPTDCPGSSVTGMLGMRMSMTTVRE